MGLVTALVADPQFIIMSVDPYHEVQSEIQSSLQTAEQLRATFLRIRSTAHDGNEELEWARNEVSCREPSVRRNCLITWILAPYYS